MKQLIKEGLAWGLSSQIDIEGANISLIQDKEYVKKYIVDLCDFIKMKRYGDTWIERFGNESHLYGITVLQAIETSCITGHFCEADGGIFIDLFSCSEYDPLQVLQFTINFFQGKNGRVAVANYRGIKDPTHINKKSHIFMYDTMI